MGDIYPNGYPVYNPFVDPNTGGGGSPGTAGQSSSGAPWYQQGWVYNAADLLLQAGSSYLGTQSAKEANRKNIQLSREQRAWEEQMSNTAIQRRADDFEKAGFNRALAATGIGASTPSVGSPTVATTFNPDWVKGNTAAGVIAGATLRQMEANTALTLAQGRKTGVEADVLAGTSQSTVDSTNVKNIEEQEWSRIKTTILRNTASSTASKAKLDRETVDSAITAIKNAAQRGTLELSQLANLLRGAGIDDDDGQIMSLFKQLLIRYATK